MKKIIFTTTILVLFVSCTVTKNTARHSALDAESSANNTSPQPSPKEREQSPSFGGVRGGDSRNAKNAKNAETKQNTVSSTAQTQEKSDYNPYGYEERKAEQEQIRVDGYKEFLAKECDVLQLQIWQEQYNTSKDAQFLVYINGYSNCPEVIDFAIDLINTSPDKESRKIAIGMLGFRRYYDAIPLLLNHVKKDISSDEKIAVATALTILDKKTEALEIFDCNCYNMDNMDNTCVYYYFNMFDKTTALKYFEHYFNKPQTQLEAACWLAMCGVYDKTFPLFVKFLENNTTYSRGIDYSLVGLAAIGTEEALEIIKQQTKNNTSLIARSAVHTLDVIKGRWRK